MTSALEVLLELEFLQTDLVLHPLRGVSDKQVSILLSTLLGSMVTLLRNTMSKDSLDHNQQITSGAMI